MSRLQRHLDRVQTTTDEGFTLIELLIVIVVLGILAAVVVLALGPVNQTAKQSACFDDATTIETAVGAYNAQNPTPIGVESTSGVDTVTITGSTAGISAGQVVHDTTHAVSDSTVTAVIDLTHFSVPNGDTAVFTAGDAISVGGVAKGTATFTPGGAIAVGTASTYAGPGTQAAKLISGGYLRSWPSGAASQGYAMSLSTLIAGDIAVYIPATSSSTGQDFEHESSSNGCNSSLL